jgi:hypothetical protein
MTLAEHSVEPWSTQPEWVPATSPCITPTAWASPVPAPVGAKTGPPLSPVPDATPPSAR